MMGPKLFSRISAELETRDKSRPTSLKMFPLCQSQLPTSNRSGDRLFTYGWRTGGITLKRLAMAKE